VKLLRSRSGPPRDITSALVVGDPGSDLPYARRECDWLTEQLRQRDIETASFAGETATLDAIVGSLASADLIHLSCHGYFNPVRLERSHIRLFSHSGSSGFLSLPLISAARLEARLVMLPSCYAGAGRVRLGNEISGFVWEFIRAGAGTVIAPLWELEDRAGFELSCHFYTALLNGKSSAESLRFAKLQLLKCDGR
jgi:CHAT domain-containing protein